MLRLQCLEWTNRGCSLYQGTFESAPLEVLAVALPVLGVFVVLGVGLLLGRSVWS